jgi:enoyl-CoA hydratase/carnithine racemase
MAYQDLIVDVNDRFVGMITLNRPDQNEYVQQPDGRRAARCPRVS